MSQSNTSATAPIKTTPSGQLFYVMGASGAGKDSIINYAKSYISHIHPIAFSHRYITRPNTTGAENHIALTRNVFALRCQHHCFALSWHSHKTHYGIGIEINQWMKEGLNVVINGSRAHLHQAIKHYPMLIPIMIEANKEVLLERLTQRGRESAQHIQQRIAHSQTLTLNHPANMLTISNNGTLQAAGNAFINMLLSHC